MACLVVCLGDVLYGYRLGAVGCTYPVGVRQVDAYGCRGVCVACEYCGCDNLCRNTFHFFFLELLVDGRVVFKPLRVGAEGFGALAGGYVLEVDY